MSERRDRGGRALWVVAAGTAVVLVAVAAIGWWATHARAFPEDGVDVAFAIPVGEPALLGIQVFPTAPVTLRAATPRVAHNDADADLRVVLCTPSENGHVGAVRGDVATWCRRAEEVAGRLFAPPTGGFADAPALLLVVEARRAGLVRIDGVDVSFADGLRRGTQRLAMEFELRVDPECAQRQPTCVGS